MLDVVSHGGERTGFKEVLSNCSFKEAVSFA